MTREIRLAFAIFLLILMTGLVGVIWLCFSDDLFVTEKQLFRRWGFEEPPTASHVIIHDVGDVGDYIVEFRLPLRETANFVTRPLPGYGGWQRQGMDESLPPIEGRQGPRFHNAMMSQKEAGRREFVIYVDLASGDCVMYN